MTLHDGKRLEPGSGPVLGDSPLPEPLPDWTFLVYMAGDNNLEQFGLLDLAEMKAIGSTADVNIVAQFDRMTDGVTRRYHLRHDTPLDEDQVGPELGETNSGDPRELARFLAWAVEAYPAERYALVVWNHGTGWKEDDLYASLRLGTGASQRLGTSALLRVSTGGSPTRTPSSRPDIDHARLLAREVAQRPQRPVLFGDSIEAIMARGIGYDDTSSDFLDNSELQRAIDGCHHTPFNLGENDRGEKHLGLELICRDADHVTRFIENADNPPKGKSNVRRNGQPERACTAI